jgi:hypothetical protein
MTQSVLLKHGLSGKIVMRETEVDHAKLGDPVDLMRIRSVVHTSLSTRDLKTA